MTHEAWEAAQPALPRALDDVLRVWSFCGGWDPHSLPLAVGYYGVNDVARLIDGLLVLRAFVAKRNAPAGGG